MMIAQTKTQMIVDGNKVTLTRTLHEVKDHSRLTVKEREAVAKGELKVYNLHGDLGFYDFVVSQQQPLVADSEAKAINALNDLDDALTDALETSLPIAFQKRYGFPMAR